MAETVLEFANRVVNSHRELVRAQRAMDGIAAYSSEITKLKNVIKDLNSKEVMLLSQEVIRLNYSNNDWIIRTRTAFEPFFINGPVSRNELPHCTDFINSMLDLGILIEEGNTVRLIAEEDIK